MPWWTGVIASDGFSSADWGVLGPRRGLRGGVWQGPFPAMVFTTYGILDGAIAAGEAVCD
jgi:hypothetical protein